MDLHDIKNCGCNACEGIRNHKGSSLLAREVHNLTFHQIINVFLNIGLLFYRADDRADLFDTYPEALQVKVAAATAAEFINEVRQASLDHTRKDLH